MTEADICQNYHQGDECSTAAWDRAKVTAAADRMRILTLVENAKDGLTCDEAERLLGISHQTCSARFSDLQRTGAIKRRGDKRPTRTGSQAHIYTV